MCSTSTSTISQLFPPTPTFTEETLQDLAGKVVLITGAASGIGLELAKIVYSKNATVYIAARSVERANAGIQAIKAEHPSSNSHLSPLAIDLSNLATVKPAVDEFLRKESRLDVLVHNAGVMMPPAGATSEQGYDLEMATNCLGPFLLNKLLSLVMHQTAQSEPPNSVRQIWVSSSVGMNAPKGGVQFDDSGKPTGKLEGMDNYMQTKAGGALLAAEFAKRSASSKVLSLSLNPGIINTELQRNMPSVAQKVMGVVFKPAKFGAYTELYAAFSPEITSTDNGTFYIPWGRRGKLPAHMENSLKTEEEGGSGVAGQFWRWCEEETKQYA
ncbi:short-chain dehydrogenase [Neofusicoccum parvum]|nr:short-chain dehydrogenase [Neofusicoccum parvum]